MNELKKDLIRKHCAPIIGHVIERYETAELLCEHDGTWIDWPDLPIRIYFSSGSLISISWSRFDDLWISSDDTLPYPTNADTTRWKTNKYANINPIIGNQIRGVALGRGEMTVNSIDMPIWSRLVFDLGDSWFEIDNALDENAYDLHIEKPVGIFEICT